MASVQEVPASVLSDAQSLWQRLCTNQYGLGTSEGIAFGEAFFARDNLMNAYYRLNTQPEIAYKVILAVAAQVGIRRNWRTLEEPGKMHHELHPLKNAGKDLKLWSKMWGGNKHGWLVYMAADTTALFVRLVTAYCAQQGRAILRELVVRRDGTKLPLAHIVSAAVGWIARSVHRPTGLVVSKRRNPLGLFHQDWKDSPLAYPYRDGRQAGYIWPLAYAELQAWSIEALKQAPHLDIGITDRYADLVPDMKYALEEIFWLPGDGYAPVVELINGQPSRVDIPASNEAWLLDTPHFDAHKAGDYMVRVESIIRRYFGPDFLTDAGIRSRSLTGEGAVPVIDYDSHWTVWPIDTFIFIRGLLQHGFPLLAKNLADRTLKSLEAARHLDEYFIVTPDGRLLMRPQSAISTEAGALKTTRLPEAKQAWTAMAVLELAQMYKDGFTRPQGPWQCRLEDNILASLPEPQYLPADGRLKLNALGDITSLIRYAPKPYLRAAVDYGRTKLGFASSDV